MPEQFLNSGHGSFWETLRQLPHKLLSNELPRSIFQAFLMSVQFFFTSDKVEDDHAQFQKLLSYKYIGTNRSNFKCACVVATAIKCCQCINYMGEYGGFETMTQYGCSGVRIRGESTQRDGLPADPRGNRHAYPEHDHKPKHKVMRTIGQSLRAFLIFNV